jgi:hypothetical protein
MEATATDYVDLLPGLDSEGMTEELAVSIFERCRRLMGNWKATPVGGQMQLEWPGHLG